MACVSYTFIVSLVLRLVGFLLHAGSWYTTYWHREVQPSGDHVIRTVHYGLWELCQENETVTTCYNIADTPYNQDHVIKTLYLEVWGMVLAFLAVLMQVVVLCIQATCPCQGQGESTDDSRSLWNYTTLLTFLGCGVFALHEVHSLSWSFLLCCIAATFYTMGSPTVMAVFLRSQPGKNEAMGKDSGTKIVLVESV
ncbi:hypothetical protein BaRGS_00005793 [Batillaria attramentaria]|uniref:Uncharacterized protein n=1 Tax=Batillaria attramentaria TaxID=370345 RepID=A0ABD0LTE8_9CAEN